MLVVGIEAYPFSGLMPPCGSPKVKTKCIDFQQWKNRENPVLRANLDHPLALEAVPDLWPRPVPSDQCPERSQGTSLASEIKNDRIEKILAKNNVFTYLHFSFRSYSIWRSS